MKFKKLAGKYASLYSNRITTRKALPLSYASLFLAILILVTGTVSWFSVHESASIESKDLSFDSSTGLRVNDGEDLTNHIKLEKFMLEEASSVDGRNFFLPATGTFSSTTELMKFREGNVGDKNKKYAYKDFTLSGEKNTKVYIKNYKIVIGEGAEAITFDGAPEIKTVNDQPDGKPIQQVRKPECPVRIAFITDSSEKPVVFDPTAIVTQHAKDYNAVNFADDSGNALTAVSTATAFSKYYFNYVTGEPIYTLNDSRTVKATMVVWLEGTGNNWEKYAGKKISVDVELESNWSEMEYVYFNDQTLNDDDGGGLGQWVDKADDNGQPCLVLMSYTDPKTKAIKSVIMDKKQAHLWVAPIPKNVVTNISFYRYSQSEDTIFNAWHTNANVMSQISDKVRNDWIGPDKIFKQELETSRKSADGNTTYTTYTAKRGNGYGYVSETDDKKDEKRLSPCVGYWNYTGDGGEVVEPTTAQPVIPGETVKINGISLEVRNEDWRTKIREKQYDVYVVFEDGYKMSLPSTGYFYYEVSKVDVPNKKIQGFEFKNSINEVETQPIQNQINPGIDKQYNYKLLESGELVLK